MKCPTCKTENDDIREVCENCGTRLKTVNVSRMSSFIPLDTPGKVGDYTRNNFVNVTAGTELWKKVGWKGFLIFLLSLGTIALILLLISKWLFK